MRAAARATIIDTSGKVLADSEADPANMENHASRKEFAAALSGKTGENERRSAHSGYSIPICRNPYHRRRGQACLSTFRPVKQSRRRCAAI